MTPPIRSPRRHPGGTKWPLALAGLAVLAGLALVAFAASRLLQSDAPAPAAMIPDASSPAGAAPPTAAPDSAPPASAVDTVAAAPDSAPTPAPMPSPQPPARATPTQPAPTRPPAAAPATSAAPAGPAAATPGTPPATTPPAAAGGWAVQVGAFRDAGNAARLAERVTALGFRGAAEPLPDGRVRVRATGLASEPAARAAADSIGRVLRLAPIVVAPGR